MAKDTDGKSGRTNSTSGMGFDFTKLMGQYKLPGVDLSAIVERERKNIEALTRANRIAFEGWQALVAKQSEILQETMTRTIANARKQDAAKARAEMAKQGFEKALDDMRELAEMATRSQKQALEVMRQRFSENMEEMRGARKEK
jgi:phasin family protein